MTSPGETPQADAPEPGSLAPGPSRLPVPDPDPEPVTVPSPDPAAREAAETLVRAHPELGRLGGVVVWLSGTGGAAPPPRPAAPAALVVAAAHDVARYVDGRPTSPVSQRAAEIGSDRMRVRVLDLSAPGEWQVRASAGAIGREDALTDDEALRAYALGQLAVDQEVDGGTDLLLVGDVADDNGCSVAALAAVLTGTEPTACVRRGPEPAAWARAVEVVRDARQRGKALFSEPFALLSAVGGPDLAALTGILVQAAMRRTPVLLGGAAAHVAGLLAESCAAGARAWWMSAASSGDPAEALARTRLVLEPVLPLDLGLDACGTALLAYPVVQAALDVVRDDAPTV